VNGALCEIKGPISKKYKVVFSDNKTGHVHYVSEITNNMWVKSTIEYFVEWNIKVYELDTDELVFEHIYDCKDKRVYIHLDSSAIGDTMAWFPYVDEFRKKHGCKVLCSTYHNEWFEQMYPEIEFIKPGTPVNDLYAMYKIGWFYDDKEIVKSKIPIDFKQHPLQEASSCILGLDYTEIKPKISVPDEPSRIEGKYVIIAPHASAHAKYWNHPGGWQGVIDHLNDNGYKVVMITSEKLGDEWHDSKLGGTLNNVIDKTGGHINLVDRMIDIKHASAFIGLGSGLSWLSWAIGTPTVLISGFSYPLSEFSDCERIFNPDVCNGCFNRHWLNPGDWEWCPDHKDTPRHFECSKTIKTQTVIDAVNKLLIEKKGFL
jgi:autotransporter strand-loop-strand O-heptosyltransferase